MQKCIDPPARFPVDHLRIGFFDRHAPDLPNQTGRFFLVVEQRHVAKIPAAVSERRDAGQHHRLSERSRFLHRQRIRFVSAELDVTVAIPHESVRILLIPDRDHLFPEPVFKDRLFHRAGQLAVPDYDPAKRYTLRVQKLCGLDDPQRVLFRAEPSDGQKPDSAAVRVLRTRRLRTLPDPFDIDQVRQNGDVFKRGERFPQNRARRFRYRKDAVVSGIVLRVEPFHRFREGIRPMMVKRVFPLCPHPVDHVILQIADMRIRNRDIVRFADPRNRKPPLLSERAAKRYSKPAAQYASAFICGSNAFRARQTDPVDAVRKPDLLRKGAAPDQYVDIARFPAIRSERGKALCDAAHHERIHRNEHFLSFRRYCLFRLHTCYAFSFAEKYPRIKNEPYMT